MIEWIVVEMKEESVYENSLLEINGTLLEWHLKIAFILN